MTQHLIQLIPPHLYGLGLILTENSIDDIEIRRWRLESSDADLALPLIIALLEAVQEELTMETPNWQARHALTHIIQAIRELKEAEAHLD